MKYLLFQNPLKDYGATFDTVLVGARKRGFGAYEDRDAKLLLKLAPENHISEITEEQYEGLKKKLSLPSASYKVLGTVVQDPSKDPNAVYAKKEAQEVPSKKKGKPAKDLVSVGKAKVEDPLEGKE
jgi:hypothetical protein